MNCKRRPRSILKFIFTASSFSNLSGMPRLRLTSRFLEAARDANESLECTDVFMFVACCTVDEAQHCASGLRKDRSLLCFRKAFYEAFVLFHCPPLFLLSAVICRLKVACRLS